MNDFIRKIEDQLKRMTVEEKDQWILEQAKIHPEWQQEDFYKSICGKKKVIDMPDRSEISGFCEKVRNGNICVVYETHYVEFDESGYFHDDWEHDFYDPQQAMSFIETVLSGCHAMIVLEEYSAAFEILDKIIGLKLRIEDHPDTEDPCAEEFLDLNEAVKERLLFIDRDALFRDYIESCRWGFADSKFKSEKIVALIEMDLFSKCNMDYFASVPADDPLMKAIGEKLEAEVIRLEKELAEKSAKSKDHIYGFFEKEKIRYIKILTEFFKPKEKKKEEPAASFLRGTWKQISGLIEDLQREPYIDDQVQITQIWEIIGALLKRGGFDKEQWEVKEHILKEIYKNDYYDYYGVSDPMMELEKAICSDKEENLKRAEIMMKAGRSYMGTKAAKLYLELGETEKCVQYFEQHLGKEAEPYLILLDYYSEKAPGKAVEVANQAIQKCKEDQTPFFLYLLQDAKDRGDGITFKKLMHSAHARRAVQSAEVDRQFSQQNTFVEGLV